VRAVHGVILSNVGTPDSPSVADVRKYLAVFLNDPRVIDLPTPLRWMLLNLIILPFRPSRSAHAYQQIWTPEGSPLLVNAKAQLAALRAEMPGVEVELAMSYGKPSMQDALSALQSRGVTHITLVPMFPQYASATTGGTVEAWHKLLGQQIHPPATAVLPAFHAAPGFIAAFAERIRETVAAAKPDHVLFSFHGLPIRQLAPVCADSAAGKPCGPLGGDHQHCYRAQCLATADALTAAAGLTSVSTAFQSRLKGATWLSPFTDEVVAELAKKGVKRLVVACPSFVADCLETLEEIGLRAAETFKEAGGEALTLVPSVNASPLFISSLAEELRRSAP
jgi:ferrochelatase